MAKCVPCLGKDIKQVIANEINDRNVITTLNIIADCDDPMGIELCGKVGKGQRARSEYQQFVSVCMKGKNIKGFGEAPKAMKECASEWRSRK